MNPLSIGQAGIPPPREQQHFLLQAAHHLRRLDHSAKTADARQRHAVSQQIDAVWRRVLEGVCNMDEAMQRAAFVAGCMLGGVLLPEDLHRARRTGRGLRMSDPYPLAAASLYALLDAMEVQASTQALEDAFAHMHVCTGQSAPFAFGPAPPGPSPLGPRSHL